MRKSRWLVLWALALTLVSAPAFAQTQTTSLSGLVVDKDGGVIPGASVIVKNDATGVSLSSVTNSVGRFSFPSLDVGTYTVTIKLQGFKTSEHKDVRLQAGVPGDLGKTTLEVGGMTETVEVKGATDVVRTQTPTVSSTVGTEFISQLPRGDRNALSFLIFLPGVNTSGGAQNSRSSTIAGLPQNTINISIDGVSTSNNLQTTDGFFTLVTPRLDSVEEVTMTTAGSGADASGSGTVQIQFVTRSGTNKFQTSLYEYFKHASLNSNSFLGLATGLPKPRATVDTYGGRIGGPIWIPGLFDGHGKAFFFFNQEEIWQPSQVQRTRTVILPQVQAGLFTYGSSTIHQVNVLTLAQQTGNLFAVDPLVNYVLNTIAGITNTTGTLQTSPTTPNTQSYNYLVSIASKRHSPTGRVDVNLNSRNRLSGTYYWQRLVDSPDTLNSADPTFPGLPTHAGQTSYRTTGSSTLRTTFGNNFVNEVLVGWQWSPVSFFADSSPAMFSDPAMNTQGYFLSLGFGLTNPATGRANGPEVRDTVNVNVNDNVNWLKGNHSIKMGFQFTRLVNWIDDWTNVPQMTLGLSSSTGNTDPALLMFNTNNFPGATTGDLNNARALYGLLTGRVQSIPGTGQLNKTGDTYIYNGHAYYREHQDVYGGYISDSWRWRPNVTLTGGLRYEVQMPLIGDTGNLTSTTLADSCGISGLGSGTFDGRQCNLFQPGVFNNSAFVSTNYNPLGPGNRGFKIDLNNLAPDGGVNWRPNVKSGLLRKILGDPEQATVSGGWSRTYNRPRFDQFTNVYTGNPGATTPADRGFSAGNFCLICPGAPNREPLLSEPSLLGQPAFLQSPVYPIVQGLSGSAWTIDQNIQTPYTDSWTIGLQRALTRDMAVEVRYIANQNKAPWAIENWNVANFRETGLVGVNSIDNVANQFSLAENNLVANLAAGRGATFAYFGAGTGTSPLPLFLAAFSGVAPANAGNATLYNSSQWTNATWVNQLNPFSPSPQSIATSLATGSNGATQQGWLKNLNSVGYPINFFQINPTVNGVEVTRNSGTSKYKSIQVDLRRRFSHGLQFQASYTYAYADAFSLFDLHLPLFDQRSTAQIPHALKTIWTWQIPVGRGQRFGGNMNKWLDGVIGGWSFAGAGRFQLPLFRLSNTVLVGMTQKEAQAFFKQIRINVDPNGTVTVWDMPANIVTNTSLAYSTGAVKGYYLNGTPTGAYFQSANHPAGWNGPSDPGCFAILPGDCAPDMYFYGKWFGEVDVRLTKQFHVTKRVTAEMSAEVFNVLNGHNFNEALNPSSSLSTFGVSLTTGSNARNGQLSWRVSW